MKSGFYFYSLKMSMIILSEGPENLIVRILTIYVAFFISYVIIMYPFYLAYKLTIATYNRIITIIGKLDSIVSYTAIIINNIPSTLFELAEYFIQFFLVIYVAIRSGNENINKVVKDVLEDSDILIFCSTWFIVTVFGNIILYIIILNDL
jgi:hypothetical protein